MKRLFAGFIIGALASLFVAFPAQAAYDMVALGIDNVTTGATANTTTKQIPGKVERIKVVASASAGIDWSIKSAADGTVLYAGTNLADTAVVSTSNQVPFIGITLSAVSADATNKNIDATIIYSK